jgi:2-phospho-L-lactate/phosphoenolpyruvate guanylyltransferase
MTAAVIPVKPLAAGKSRLVDVLGRAGAEKLALAMLEDVVAALRAVRRLDPVAVVTPDPAVARAAERAGARALLGPDPGLNASLDRAGRELADVPGGLLVVLGDVAGARPEDIETLLDALEKLGARGVALAPSSDGGTAALARNPHDAIPCRFGPGSAEAHRREARRRGVPLAELELASLAVDLDSEADLAAFLAGPGAGRRTRTALRDLGVGEAD